MHDRKFEKYAVLLAWVVLLAVHTGRAPAATVDVASITAVRLLAFPDTPGALDNRY